MRAEEPAAVAPNRFVRRLDEYQRLHPWAGFPVAVMKKFVEDKCPSLAALLAYYGLLSIFPLLLVLLTLLALLFGHDTSLQHRVIHSALAQFPVIGKQLGNLHGIASLHKRGGIGLIAGLIGLLWGSLGVTKAGQRAMADIWNVPHLLRPHFVRRIGRGIEFLGVLVLDVVLSTALAGLVTFGGHALWFQIVAVIVGLALNVSLFMLGFRILTPEVDRDEDAHDGRRMRGRGVELAPVRGHVAHRARTSTRQPALRLLRECPRSRLLPLRRGDTHGGRRRDRRGAHPTPLSSKPARSAHAAPTSAS